MNSSNLRPFRFLTSLYLFLLIGLPQCLAQRPNIETELRNVRAGEPVEIEYTPASAVARLVLRRGDNTNLDTVETLTETATGGKWMWEVSDSIPSGDDYVLEIMIDDESNFSDVFRIDGEVPPTTTLPLSSEPTVSIATGSTVTGFSTTSESSSSSTLSGIATSTGGFRSEETSNTNGNGAPAASSNSGLNTAAMAGIGAGVGVAVIGIVVGAFLLGKRTRRNKSPKTQDTEGKPELDGRGVAGGKLQVFELRASRDTAELDTEKVVYPKVDGTGRDPRNEPEPVIWEMSSTPILPRLGPAAEHGNVQRSSSSSSEHANREIYAHRMVEDRH